MAEHVLVAALTELRQTISEFRNSRFPDHAHVLERFVYQLSAEPLSTFLKSLGDPSDFDAWWEGTHQGVHGSLRWPVEAEKRTLYRVSLCRQITSSGQQGLLDFAMHFTRRGRSTDLDAIMGSFRDAVLDPLVTELASLAQRRAIPPAVAQALRDVPLSGDEAFDTLVADACARFREVGPASLKDAVEKLWDAWERIKTIPDSDKKRSLDALINQSADSDLLREVLHAEANWLKTIGNQFMIRHYERDKTPITKPDHLEYVFLRMLAMLRLLIRALASKRAEP